MYQRDIPKLPKTITRNAFVNMVFDLGHRYQHGYDTIVASVQLGDYFVSFKGERRPFFLLSQGEKIEQPPFMYELVPQIYSTELAYVVTVIMAKSNEDDGYQCTDDAVSDTNNRYISKMEWEICTLLNFNIKVYNFITLIGTIILTTLNNNETTDDLSSFTLHSMFFDLSKEICLNRDLLAKDPKVIVTGCILLHQAGKLRAARTNKERKFHEAMMKISREYELDLDELLNAYIKFKKEGPPIQDIVIPPKTKDTFIQIPIYIFDVSKI